MPLPARPTYDPFIGTVTQTHRLRAVCRIIVEGVDVTAKIDPHLINVHVIDGPHAELHVELDDRDGRLPIPPLDSRIVVMLGWYNEPVWKVFGGFIIDVEHGFGREQGGRRLWIHATGVRWTIGKAAEMNSWGEGEDVDGKSQKIPLSQVLQDAGSSQGFDIKVHDTFGSKQRNFWMQNMESFLHFGQRMANEHGGLFRVTDGNQAVLTDYGVNADGSSVATINAKWNDNLIGWRVHPIVAKNTWKGSVQGYYDSIKSVWNKVQKTFDAGGIAGALGSNASTYGHSGSAANKGNAEQDNSGAEGQVSNEFGEGRIVINGEPRAAWNCKVQLIGARLGVDGLYLALQVEHIYSRQGYVTWLDVIPIHVTDGVNVSDGLRILNRSTGQTMTYKQYEDWVKSQTGGVVSEGG